MSPRAVLELVALAAIWGASFLFMRIAAPEFGPAMLIEIRVAIAALFLSGWLALRGEFGALQGRLRDLAVLGAMNSALPFSLFAFATLSLPAGLSSVLNATVPLFVVAIGFLWLRERLAPVRLLGLVIGFAGVLVLVGHKLTLTADRTAVLAGLSAAACYGFSSHYTKRRLGGLTPLAIAAGSQIAASIVLLPVALAALPAQVPSTAAFACAALLGVVCTGVAYVLFFRLLRGVGAARASTVTFLIPIFGMTWGYLFLDERLPLQAIAGAAVVLFGTLLVARGSRAPAPAPLPTAACPQSPPRVAP
ncbi:MAG: DMT family transporter [Planctomycetes bacterium]|nr:DMT family transporter [Planctomycetota bacterium]